MPVTVKRASLWTIDTPNHPGTLAATLQPLAEGKVNLDLVMGYSLPDKSAATIEVYPVTTQQGQRTARATGFRKSPFPCVSVTGTNCVGLGRRIAAALAEAGININFFLAQVVDKRYTAMFSFEADSEADLAVKIIRKAVKTEPAVAGNRKASKKTGRSSASAARATRSVSRKKSAGGAAKKTIRSKARRRR
ncbi:MAG: hypothetical protein ACE5EQ_08605 [Phycisphaerae bacterium]